MHKRSQAHVQLDALQWLVEDCLQTNDPREADPQTITYRLLILNMTAIHTTSMTMTHTLYNIHASPDADHLIATLRQECANVLANHGGSWTKPALNDLVGLDSTIRESMRISDLEPLTVARQVVDPRGITLQCGRNAAIHVPLGANVCLPASSVHRDPSIYNKPLQFLPFRFSAPAGQEEAKKPADDETNTDGKRTVPGFTASAVTTSDRFLAFGHGRHACPGRFFALVELKLMLAYVLQNYDVEKLDGRPRDTALFGALIPNRKAVMRIRRRDQGAV